MGQSADAASNKTFQSPFRIFVKCQVRTGFDKQCSLRNGFGGQVKGAVRSRPPSDVIATLLLSHDQSFPFGRDGVQSAGNWRSFQKTRPTRIRSMRYDLRNCFILYKYIR